MFEASKIFLDAINGLFECSKIFFDASNAVFDGSKIVFDASNAVFECSKIVYECSNFVSEAWNKSLKWCCKFFAVKNFGLVPKLNLGTSLVQISEAN